MIGLEQYYFESNVLQTPIMIALEIVEMYIWLEKIHFADLVNDDKSVAGFSASCKF